MHHNNRKPNQLLQGETSGLQFLKEAAHTINLVVIVDRMPDKESNEPVMTTYTLNNGTKIKEPLIYVQMVSKARKVLCMLPDNGRNSNLRSSAA